MRVIGRNHKRGRKERLMEYRNELGQTITDEQVDKMLEEIESGDFSNFESVRNTA